jgi:hypothetical protein
MPEFICIPPISISKSFIVIADDLSAARNYLGMLVGRCAWNYTCLNLDVIIKISQGNEKITQSKI